MGFFSRWKHVNTPRAAGTGRLWDNVNSGGTSVKTPQTTMGGNALMSPYENYFVAGPNPEPYLKTAAWKDPDRLHGPPMDLQPPIPVREPTTDIGSMITYINQQGAVANPKVLPKNTSVRAAAPSLTTIRDLLYDGFDARSIQRFQLVTDTQRYYDQRTPLPEFTTPSMPSHMVQMPGMYMQRGWYQSFVPEPGMHMNEVGAAPPTLLSAPMHVTTIVSAGAVRAPLKSAKAPERRKQVEAGGKR